MKLTNFKPACALNQLCFVFSFFFLYDFIEKKNKDLGLEGKNMVGGVTENEELFSIPIS